MQKSKNPMIAAVALTLLIALGGCTVVQYTPPSSPTAASPSPSLSLSPTDTTATPQPSPTGSDGAITASAASTETVSNSQPPTAIAEPTPSSSSDATNTMPSVSPLPTPIHDGDRPDVTVVKYYDTPMPDSLKISLIYKNYAAPLSYFVTLRSGVIRALPANSAKSLQKVGRARRLPMIAEVKGMDGKSLWYRVRISNTAIGYIAASAGSPRVFQLEKALIRAQKMKETADLPATIHINNYKNRAGLPPALPGGKAEDAWGYRRDQSAPAYLSPSTTSAFRYVPDGMIGRKISESGDFVWVYLPTFDEVRYIPKRFLTKTVDEVLSLTQVVVVDRKNQNVIALEYATDGWRVVSMSYVSTGKVGKYSLKTPLGEFCTLVKASKFFYYGDGTDEYAGFAPYAVRFCSGAWLHGVPHNIKPNPVTDKITLPKTYIEALSTLGTTPQSHMCVRNYTSHALFLYNWLKIGSSGVIVIE